MAQFSIYASESLVGYSMLEHGDPPMGVAFGVFNPAGAYSEIQRECQTNHSDQSSLHLSVRTESGAEIPCVGVGILDYSAEIDPPYIEINVLGIPYPLYGELFTSHVARYEEQFREEPPHLQVTHGGA
jgi:hypothetical protein